MKPEIIFIGVLALLRGLLALLDRIWQRLDKAGASMRMKTTLLTLPMAIGTTVVTGLYLLPEVRPVEVSAIVSAAMVAGLIVAGVIMLALRMARMEN